MQSEPDFLRLVHPDLVQTCIDYNRAAESQPALSSASLEWWRSRSAQFIPKNASTLAESRHLVRPGQNRAIQVHVFNATGHDRNRPAILHMHGGGFVLGTALADAVMLSNLAHELDCVVVAVDYPLAPESRWSDSCEDNYAALEWLYAHAERLGVDRRRIVVMGESAGGGHAALLAIRARDRGVIQLRAQILTAPMLSDRTGHSRQLPGHMGQLGWTSEKNQFGWRAFLGKEPGSHNVPESAVPSRLARCAGLAPAWIGVGSLDLFALENVEYATRLMLAGVQTELLVVPGAFHSFESLAPETPIARTFLDSRRNALRTAFALPETQL